jgi:hypothetical protein
MKDLTKEQKEAQTIIFNLIAKSVSVLTEEQLVSANLALTFTGKIPDYNYAYNKAYALGLIREDGSPLSELLKVAVIDELEKREL